MKSYITMHYHVLKYLKEFSKKKNTDHTIIMAKASQYNNKNNVDVIYIIISTLNVT